MRFRKTTASRAAAKAKQIRRQVAAMRIITDGDSELIKLAAEAWANWKSAVDLIRSDGILTLVPTHFGNVYKKHPAVEAERQFHNEYVARLYDLQILTKEKKAARSTSPVAKPGSSSSGDPFEGLIFRFKDAPA